MSIYRIFFAVIVCPKEPHFNPLGLLFPVTFGHISIPTYRRNQNFPIPHTIPQETNQILEPASLWITTSINPSCINARRDLSNPQQKGYLQDVVWPIQDTCNPQDYAVFEKDFIDSCQPHICVHV